MVRTGKEPTHESPEADPPEAPETVVNTRWLNGVNCQLRPGADQQRQAASRAAAEQRKANAMSEDERAAKRALHAKEVRARKKATIP